jgi:uridine phosphorylase
MSRSAAFPWRKGRPTHLPCGPGDVPRVVLLPGDPARVERAKTLLTDVTDFGQRREFGMIRGRHDGVDLAVCSTGIGGPSTEIALVELANLGMTHAIRTGGMGAIGPDLRPGGFLIVDRALRGSGAAKPYLPGDAPVAASSAIVAALSRAARRLELPARAGMIATTDSYYWGQGRPVREGAAAPDVLAGLAQAGALGVDMEAEVVLALGQALGFAAGAVLAVHANRASDEWLEDYDEAQTNVLRLGMLAAKLLIEDGEETQC